MAYVKAISGHTKLGAAQRYLEREGRALARDFLNLDAPMEGLDADGDPEYREFDWASRWTALVKNWAMTGRLGTGKHAPTSTMSYPPTRGTQ